MKHAREDTIVLTFTALEGRKDRKRESLQGRMAAAA
jgi:hypothetical protein